MGKEKSTHHATGLLKPVLGAGGDYRGGGVGSSRTAQEQHPLHLHGHHFWLLGQGMGIYNESTNSSSLNYVNPAYRDSCTVFKNGWTVMRFKVQACSRSRRILCACRHHVDWCHGLY